MTQFIINLVTMPKSMQVMATIKYTMMPTLGTFKLMLELAMIPFTMLPHM